MNILKKKTILARIMDVGGILAGEYAENEVHNNYNPSERAGHFFSRFRTARMRPLPAGAEKSSGRFPSACA